MHKIYIGFSTPKTFKIGAQAIKAWIKKPYSHVFVAWKSDQFSRVLLYHAAHGSVHFRSSGLFLEENKIVKLYEIWLTDEQYKSLIQKCIDLSGINYGYAELIKILVKDTCDLLGFQCKMVENSRGYICSELLAELLIGLGAVFTRPAHLVRPDQIEDSLAQIKAQEVRVEELSL
jgi:hypothetical protein